MPVGFENAADREGVWVEGEYGCRSVCVFGGFGLEGRVPRCSLGTGQSFADDGLRICAVDEERRHVLGQRIKVFVLCTDPAKTEKFRVGDAVLGGWWVGRGVM